MKVSVLIPYYNDERFLRQSIESVLAQTFADFELVLVNHASTDGSRALARSFDDLRIVHVDMPVNHGAGGGLVVAEFLKVARGEYVKFFCADDVMRPECLSLLAGFMDSHPEDGLVFGDLAYVGVGGAALGARWSAERPRFSFTMSETDCLGLMADGWSVLPWSGSMVRRAALGRIELDATLVMMFDMSVWARLLLNGERMAFVESVVADYRVHDGQVSATSRLAEAVASSLLERQVYFRIFQECSDVALVKKVFPGSRYVAMLETAADIPLAVALRYLADGQDVTWAYQFVHDALQRAEGRSLAERRFGVTVAAFRELVRGRAEPPRKRSRWNEFRDKWLRRGKRGHGQSNGFSL